MEPEMQKTDEELIYDYQRFDSQEALEMLYERYKKPMLNFCLRILNNRADAEDAASEVFITLFAKKYTPQRDVKFSTWLFAVAHNSCISRYRQKKKWFSLTMTSVENHKTEERDVPDTQPSHREAMVAKEKARLVQKAVCRLPFSLKEPLVLREYHELSYEQIADVLQCSLAQVKVRIFRAREHLRSELQSLLREENHG